GCSRRRRHNRHWRRSDLAKRRHEQNNIDASLSFWRRIVFGCLLPQEVDRLANGCVAKFNPWNYDAVQFVVDSRGAAGLSGKGLAAWSNSAAVLADRFFPGFFHLPKLARSRFAVSFYAVLVFGIIDFFLNAPRGGVVRIGGEYLVVSFEGEIVPPGVVIAIGFCEQSFYFFNLSNKARAHGLVEIARLGKMREHLARCATIRIVTTTQNFTQDRLRPGVIPLRDARLRQNNSSFAKALDRFVMGFSRNH